MGSYHDEIGLKCLIIKESASNINQYVLKWESMTWSSNYGDVKEFGRQYFLLKMKSIKKMRPVFFSLFWDKDTLCYCNNESEDYKLYRLRFGLVQYKQLLSWFLVDCFILFFGSQNNQQASFLGWNKAQKVIQLGPGLAHTQPMHPPYFSFKIIEPSYKCIA